jgi:hypothetical protein
LLMSPPGFKWRYFYILLSCFDIICNLINLQNIPFTSISFCFNQS